MRSAIEYPTIRFDHTSFPAHKYSFLSVVGCSVTAQYRSDSLYGAQRFKHCGAGQAAVGNYCLSRFACSLEGNNFVEWLTRRRRRLPAGGADYACTSERWTRQTGLVRQELDLRFQEGETMSDRTVFHMPTLPTGEAGLPSRNPSTSQYR